MKRPRLASAVADIWRFCDEVCWTSSNEHITTHGSKQRGSFIYILLGCCDCKIGRFIFHSVQFMEIVLATIHLHQ